MRAESVLSCPVRITVAIIVSLCVLPVIDAPGHLPFSAPVPYSRRDPVVLSRRVVASPVPAPGESAAHNRQAAAADTVPWLPEGAAAGMVAVGTGLISGSGQHPVVAAAGGDLSCFPFIAGVKMGAGGGAEA